jgi:hypothetical protein
MRSRRSRGSPAAAVSLHRRLQVGSVAQRLVLTGGLPVCAGRVAQRSFVLRCLGEPGGACPRRPSKERAYGY